MVIAVGTARGVAVLAEPRDRVVVVGVGRVGQRPHQVKVSGGPPQSSGGPGTVENLEDVLGTGFPDLFQRDGVPPVVAEVVLVGEPLALLGSDRDEAFALRADARRIGSGVNDRVCVVLEGVLCDSAVPLHVLLPESVSCSTTPLAA